MKRVILLTIILTIFALSIGSQIQDAKWEYASLVLLPSTENVIFKSPSEEFEASSFLGINEKIGYIGKPTFPPEYPLLNYLGKQGWELIEITGKENSMSGSYTCWFKRRK